MATQSMARVLVIDNDPRVGEDLGAMLEPLGYRVEIAQGVGQVLLDRAVALAPSFRPHVAIVDLRLLDEYKDERSGFELLRSLQSVRCILYSAHLTPEVIREAFNRYGATNWVSKGESPQRLLDAIADAARASCAYQRDLSIHRPSTWTSQRIVRALFGEGGDMLPEVVEDVLSQLFPENREVTLEAVGGEVITSPPISRGRSIVLKVQPDDLEPVIVKLAPAERIRSEGANYRDYVKDRLVGRFYAQLERTVEFWDLGGAVYSFLGSSLRALPSFTVFYQKETDHQVISRPLCHFFTEVWSRHYVQSLQDRHIPLFQVYDETLRLKERLGRFRTQEERRAFPSLPVSLINPVPWILRHANDSLIPGARQAITHGDLHGDNLFVDGEHAWAIDFERTGLGHILRDFVELEADIVTRLIPFPEYDLSRFYEFAVILAEPSKPTTSLRPTAQLRADHEMRKALNVIAGLRSLAHKVTLYTDSREYLWGLLLDALFIAMLLPEDCTQRERALLFGAVLCGRLRHWGKEWPPRDWPSITESQAITLVPSTSTSQSRERLQSEAQCDVFLSYNRTDQEAVEYLGGRLRIEAGLRPWLDQWNLVPGEPWQEAVEEALDDCATCVVFWGPKGLGPWQHEEMRAALGRRVQERSYRVIPVLLPGCPEPEERKMPPFLKRVTWVDFRKGLDESEAFKRLVVGIQGVVPGPEGV